MNKLIALLVLFSVPFLYHSQNNPVGIPIQFESGAWKVINDDYGTCVLGHEVSSGPIFIMEHGCQTMNQLQNLFELGYRDEEMTLISSSPGIISGNRISMSLTGNAEGIPLKGEAIGILNNSEFCKGVVIMTVTMETEDNTKQKEAINSIANSVIYVKPLASKTWTQKLGGYKLVSRDSYSTNTYSTDGSYYTGGTSSSSHTIVFCSNGSFSSSNSSYTALSGSGLDSNLDQSNDSDSGTWSVLEIGSNNVVKMIYTDGTVVYHPISREDGFYYMANDKYTKGPNDYCE